MVKHTYTTRWLLPTNCLNVFDYFVRFALKGLIKNIRVVTEDLQLPKMWLKNQIDKLWYKLQELESYKNRN